MDAKLLIVLWRKKTCQTNLYNRAMTGALQVNLSSGFRQGYIQASLLRNLSYKIEILFIARLDMILFNKLVNNCTDQTAQASLCLCCSQMP